MLYQFWYDWNTTPALTGLKPILYCVRNNFLTLVVQLTISFIFYFITQVITMGTSSVSL